MILLALFYERKKRKKTGNEREGKLTWLVLVLSLNLQDVEKVGRRGVHLDEVLVFFGDRIGQIFYYEL